MKRPYKKREKPTPEADVINAPETEAAHETEAETINETEAEATAEVAADVTDEAAAGTTNEPEADKTAKVETAGIAENLIKVFKGKNKDKAVRQILQIIMKYGDLQEFNRITKGSNEYTIMFKLQTNDNQTEIEFNE